VTGEPTPSIGEMTPNLLALIGAKRQPSITKGRDRRRLTLARWPPSVGPRTLPFGAAPSATCSPGCSVVLALAPLSNDLSASYTAQAVIVVLNNSIRS